MGDWVKKDITQPNEGTIVDILRIRLPMVKSEKMTPNFGDLLLNILEADGFKYEVFIEIPKGTKVRPIPTIYMVGTAIF